MERLEFDLVFRRFLGVGVVGPDPEKLLPASTVQAGLVPSNSALRLAEANARRRAQPRAALIRLMSCRLKAGPSI